MASDAEAYERGVKIAQTSLTPNFREGVQANPWFQLGYQMGMKHGPRAAGMMSQAKSEFPTVAARLKASRPGQPERFGMDTRSVNAQAKRWLSIMNREKPQEGFEQFHARLKTRLEEVVRNTDELIRNPKLEEEIGGWEFDDLSRAVNSVIGYGYATRGYAEALLGHFSRPGAKDTMAVEDRFYFGKERFAENVTYTVASFIGSQPVGQRSVKSLEEAKTLAKQMLASAKGSAKGQPVVVDVYPVVNYEPKDSILALRA